MTRFVALVAESGAVRLSTLAAAGMFVATLVATLGASAPKEAAGAAGDGSLFSVLTM
ncbi:MAG TPA: hypothetical protein VKY85_26775 [Candidatus Angelobacter sp.]|nr:hypothetical protein [Candidatus Angelobacter sp.]